MLSGVAHRLQAWAACLTWLALADAVSPFELYLTLSVAKVIEIIPTSSKGFDDAVKQGVSRASETISGITGLEVSKGKITEYRVILKVTFVLKGGKGD